MIPPKAQKVGDIGETEVHEIVLDPAQQAGICFAEPDDPITNDTKIVPFSESLLHMDWLDFDTIVRTAEDTAGIQST
jgi:hypothetical protein